MNIDALHITVRDILEDEPSGHDYSHAQRVLKNAELLIDATMDHNVIFAACLVHDLMDDKLENQFTRNIEEVKQILCDCGATTSETNHIIAIIQTMSFRHNQIPSSIEGQIVQDADRLDAIGAIGIARTFAYGGANHRKMYDIDTTNGQDTVSHFYQKLFLLESKMNTKKAKHIAKERTRFMKQFLSTLYYEIGHTPST